MSMTDDDKALVERLKDEWPCMFIGDDEWLDTDALDGQRAQAADRIEALSAENERLREALTQIARLRTDLSGDFSLGSHQSDIARAALGETK